MILAPDSSMLKFVIMAACSVSCAYGFQESNGTIARSLYEGNFGHLRAMHGLSFELSTTRSLDGSSYDALRKKVPQHFPETSFIYREPKDFKETFSIKFVPKATVFPWRFRWTCDDPDEVPLEFLKQRAFYVVTDSACYSLMRPDWKAVRDRRYPAHEDFFQHLTAAAGEIPLPLNYIQLDFASPYYGLIADGICANYLCGLQVEPFGKLGDAVEKSESKIKFERVTKFGRECFSIQSEDKENGYKSSMVILGGPDYLVIENQQWAQTVQGWKVTASFEAKELGVFNGVTYPKSGIVNVSCR